MANCKELYTAGTQEYQDCLDSNKQKSNTSTILDPIGINITNENIEVPKNTYFRFKKRPTSVSSLFKNIEIGRKTTYEKSKDVTTDDGFFTVNTIQGKDNLENLFEGIPGLSVNYAGGESDDRLNLTYTDKNGKVKTSKDLRFGDEGFLGINKIIGTDLINQNMEVLNTFINENIKLGDEDLLKYLGIRTQKIEEQKKIEFNFLQGDVVNGINDKFEDPNLFLTYDKEGNANEFSIGEEFENQPYREEIVKEVKKLNNQVASGELPGATAEEIQDQALRNVRNLLKVQAITKAKKLFYADRSNTNEEIQSDDFIGSLFLKNEGENDLKNLDEDLRITVKDANLDYDVLNRGVNILNGQDNTPSNIKQFEKDAVLLGVTKPKKAFIGSVMSGKKDNAEWDIMTQKEFVEAGNPTELEEITLTNGVKTTRTMLNLQKQVYNSFVARRENYDILVEKRTDLIMDLQNNDMINNVAMKDYNDLSANIATAGLGFYDMFSQAGYLTGKLLNASLRFDKIDSSGYKMLQTNDLDRILDQMNVEQSKTSTILTDRLRDKVQFEDAFTNPVNFTKFLMEESFTQLPILLSMAAIGAPAAYIMGASGKFSDMKFSNYMGTTNYDDADLIWMPAAYGMAEGAFAQVSTVPILRRFKDRFKGNIGNSELVTKGAKEFIQENWKRAVVYDPL